MDNWRLYGKTTDLDTLKQMTTDAINGLLWEEISISVTELTDDDGECHTCEYEVYVRR